MTPYHVHFEPGLGVSDASFSLDGRLGSHDKGPGSSCRMGLGMRRFDVVAMFVSLWLLASMVLDVATPKELTVYMIGAAIAPAAAISALLYWLRVPRFDFVVCFATLWMVSGMLIELITPKPLSPLIAIVSAPCSISVAGAVGGAGQSPCRRIWPAPTECDEPLRRVGREIHTNVLGATSGPGSASKTRYYLNTISSGPAWFRKSRLGAAKPFSEVAKSS